MVNILPYSREAPCLPNFLKLCAQGEVADIITWAECFLNWSAGYGLQTPPKWLFPYLRSPRSYNSDALPTTMLHCYIKADILH